MFKLIISNKDIARIISFILTTIIFFLCKDIVFEFTYNNFKSVKNKDNFVNIYFYSVKEYIPGFINQAHHLIKAYFFCPPLAQDMLEFLKKQEDLTLHFIYNGFLWFFYFNYIMFYIIVYKLLTKIITLCIKQKKFEINFEIF